MNEFNECFREVFSAAGDIIVKSMMGGYLVYHNGKLFSTSHCLASFRFIINVLIITLSAIP